MRAIWKGAVSFGLVSIAVKLYSATEEKDIRFHQVHRTDGGRIKYQRTCSIDGEVVSYDDIAKGYDIGGGEMVILTDEDFAELPLTTSRAIDVLQFVPADDIDPILFAKAYYLEPEGQAAKPYVLLRDALRVHDDVLVLNTMLWPDEVRTPEFGFLDEDVEARPAELAMAGSLIDSMSGSFKPDEFTDNYRAALQQVIDAKVEGREIVQPEEAEEAPAAAVDLMAALKASVERAKKARGEPPEERAKSIEATPISAAKSASSGTGAKSTTAKKASPAKKATAKKATPAKKATAAPVKSGAAAKKSTPAKKAAKKSA